MWDASAWIGAASTVVSVLIAASLLIAGATVIRRADRGAGIAAIAGGVLGLLNHAVSAAGSLLLARRATDDLFYLREVQSGVHLVLSLAIAAAIVVCALRLLRALRRARPAKEAS